MINMILLLAESFCYNIISTKSTITPSPSGNELLDCFYKCSTIFIAFFNVFFTFYIFNSNNKKDKKNKSSDRKIGLLKTLILDYNLKIFYESFSKLENNLLNLKNEGNDSSSIEKDIQVDFRQLNDHFIIFLEAVDNKLYESMKNNCDTCRDTIVTNIANNSGHVFTEHEFKDLIKKPLGSSKKEMLNLLFNYKGE